MEHYNKLTPAEAERLAILAEEAGEVIHVVGKILRHGYESFNPNDKQCKSNRELLQKEVADLLATTVLMVEAKDIRKTMNEELIEILKHKHHYTHHQLK